MATDTKQKNQEFRHQDATAELRPDRSKRPSGKQPAPPTEATGATDAQGTKVAKPEHSRRDPSTRATAKPGVNLRRTSETAPLRTAMDTISECFTHCLGEGGKHVEKEHLTCMLDAWDALNATSALVARGSAHADAFRQACAEVVKACEESCEGFEDDETMAACADVCREAYEHLVA